MSGSYFKILALVVVVFLLATTSQLGLPTAVAQVLRAERGGAPAPSNVPIQVQGFVRVVDSRSLEVFINGQRVAVRIVGIDVPRDKPDCGRQATALLEQLVRDGIQLEDDPNFTFDDRGYRLYKVSTRDGRAIARELVNAGVVRPDERGKNIQELQSAQAQAQGARRGCIWQ